MTAWTLIGAIVVAVAAWLLIGGFGRVWLRYRGTRVITCPENLQAAAVKVDAGRAARWSAVSGDTPLRLSTCSRWPEKADCGQECLSEIQQSPEATLLQNIAAKWFEGKSCVYCQQTIEHIVWHERPPALLGPGGATVEWKDVTPENLPALFATHAPVCWPCHIKETFRHEHADLVIERPRPQEPVAVLSPSGAVY